MDRDVLEARAKFEAESAKDRMRVVEEVVSTLRERHDSEMREDVDMPIAEKEEAAAAHLERGMAYSGSDIGEK